jgi:hypothetical protein
MTQRATSSVPLAFYAALVIGAASWIGYAVGSGRAEERAWEEANQQSELVYVGGFCDGALDLAQMLWLEEHEMLTETYGESLAPSLMDLYAQDIIEERLHLHVFVTTKPQRDWSEICSQAIPAGGLEPSSDAFTR